jgi:hypothetical protein
MAGDIYARRSTWPPASVIICAAPDVHITVVQKSSSLPDFKPTWTYCSDERGSSLHVIKNQQ